MIRPQRVLIVALISFTSACFHQVVHSGLTPSTTAVVEQPFVSTWFWGIVPAKPIDVRQSCPTGVATVETQQSFMNSLVGVVTLGIYSPQHLRVTCAS